MVVAFQTITGAVPSPTLSYLDRKNYPKVIKQKLDPALRDEDHRLALLNKHLNYIRKEEGLNVVSNPEINVWRLAQDEKEKEVFGRLDEKKEKDNFPPKTVKIDGYKRKVEVIGDGWETIVFEIEGLPKVVFKVFRRQVPVVTENLWNGSNFEDQVVFMTIIDQILAKKVKTKTINGFKLEKIPYFPSLVYLHGVDRDLGLVIQEKCYPGSTNEKDIKKITSFLNHIGVYMQDGFKEDYPEECRNVYFTKKGELVVVDNGLVGHYNYIKEQEEGLIWKETT